MNDRPNPYVGPRPYTAQDILPARSREVLDLRRALMSARILLLHSPSGAGKTSLIEAQNGLRSDMTNRGFFVRPTVRVGQPLPNDCVDVINRYEFSVLRGLAKSEPYARLRLATTGLVNWLAERPVSHDDAAGSRRRELLIFDQFEEILTSDPTDDIGRSAFFECLTSVLEDPYRWALFIIREDYLGALDPWARRLPTLLGSRFRVDILGLDAAREAIRSPAAAQGVVFDDAALEHLVTGLSQTSVQQLDGTMERCAGLWVEPVQLQVVCRRLWAQLRTDCPRIEVTDVSKLGDIDTALASFYSEQVHSIAATLNIGERLIRDWVGTKLISRLGVRMPVMRGRESSDGLPNHAVDALESAHVIRGEDRRGIKWYELSHDRLIAPIQRNNARWEQMNLHFVQIQAAIWDRRGQPRELLLGNEALMVAADWIAAHAGSLTPIEQLYITRSAERNTARSNERAADAHLAAEQARHLRQSRMGLVLLGLALLVILGTSAYAWLLSNRTHPDEHIHKRAIVTYALTPMLKESVGSLRIEISVYQIFATPKANQNLREGLRCYLALTGPKDDLDLPVDAEIAQGCTSRASPFSGDGASRDLVADLILSAQADPELLLPRDASLIAEARSLLQR